MLKIRDIMTSDVLTLTPDTSIRAAMEFLVDNQLSGVPVVRGRKVVGVVSATDLMMFAANLGTEVPGVGVHTDVVPDETPANADADGPSSFFAETWDEDDESIAELQPPDVAEWNVLDEHEVEEVMTRTLVTLPSSASAVDAATLMEANKVHRVLVVDDEELAGIVTSLDIARAAAHRQFNVRTFVFNRGV